MLGHKLMQSFAARFETHVTFRRTPPPFMRLLTGDEFHPIDGVSAENFSSVVNALAHVRPNGVVNCIGIVKQDSAAKDPITSLTVNSLFPHQLAKLCLESEARLIHLSTDCVFSGRKGHYAENDVPDAEDLYGRTKLLGEVAGKGCLTIRTSMIGRELHGSHGLLEWFFSQRGQHVRGFKRAIFSGFTTQALSHLIAEIIVSHPELDGICHLAAEPISKFDLLTLVKQTYGFAAEIEPDEEFRCDRSLDATRFLTATGIRRPSWPAMIENMRDDPTPYEDIRRMRDS